jgi:two-component system phosphate regulon sensor histidine kinase PhoR
VTDQPLDRAAVGLRSLLDALPEPSLIVANGVIMISNRAARQILGEWIDGQDVRRAIRHPAAVERLLGSNGSSDEVELAGIGSAERRWMMNVRALDGGAKFVRLTDRSESYAAEQMRVDFVANASHELRTPLATLVGYAETLREQGGDIDSPTRERFIGIIHDEARRMQRLVEDLISLSRIEAERFSPFTEEIDLSPLIEDVIQNCRNSAAERACEVHLEVPQQLPPIAGDRSQLLQLVDNLLSNSIRYGRAGGKIVLRAVAEPNMVRLTVSDQGEGIAPEHIPRLTQRFYRVDPSRSRSQSGTGLGLAIVKYIVERHRGRLSIESRLGHGTIVHVLLPLAEGGATKV